MKKLLWIALAVFALVWLWPGGDKGEDKDGDKAPEDRLVKHMDATCAIAKKHIAKPVTGVEKLFAYLGENSPKMMKTFGRLLVEIERIPNDAEHDARARKAAERLHAAGRSCERHWEQFFMAVQRDPKARALFEHGVERFSRTLEILFGSGAEAAGALPIAWPDALRAGP